MTDRLSQVKYFPNQGQFEGETDEDGSLPAHVVSHYNVDTYNVNRQGERTTDVLDDDGNPVVSRQANLIVYPPNGVPFHVSGVPHKSSAYTKENDRQGNPIYPYHYWSELSEPVDTGQNTSSNVGNDNSGETGTTNSDNNPFS